MDYIKTEEKQIYRDPETMALIVKKDGIMKELLRRIRALERRIEQLETKLLSKDK